MGDLSKNFSRHEFACHCGCGTDNISSRQVQAVQQFRDLAGRPAVVLSGCRCPAHNQAVGGEKLSRHIAVPGKDSDAADIYFIPALSLREMYRLAEQVPGFKNGGIGLYPESDPPFIHVDIRGHRARWGRKGGETVGIEEAMHA